MTDTEHLMNIELPEAEIVALRERLETVQRRVADSARVAQRDPNDITIVAVSKTVERPVVDAAYHLGLRHFGENRVQDETVKFAFPRPDDMVLHHIGYLQSNKARALLRVANMIHAVDRNSLITALDNEAGKLAARGELAAGERIPVLLQVNVAGEEQKAGCSPEDAAEMLERLIAAENIIPAGLMTMAPLVEDAEETRPVFAGLRELRDKLVEKYPETPLDVLSMGMTNDFHIAIEEGATHVRVGRAIFGD